jgi:lactoylglutathione lyase
MSVKTKTEANVRQAVPFFMVSNMEESLPFYVDGLGFQMTKKWIDEGKLRWCWLEHGNAALMLQEFRTEGPDSRVIEGKRGLGVTICFLCEDALAIYHEVKSRGVKASTPFVGNAMWVTSVSDPDGYRIDFESCTNTPEETVFSGSQK